MHWLVLLFVLLATVPESVDLRDGGGAQFTATNGADVIICDGTGGLPPPSRP